MEWNIRGGVVEDAPALTKLNREELGYDYPEAKTREHLAALLQDPSHKILVAETGGAVSSACRRQGVGSALLAAGEEWARSMGAVAVRLVSGESRKGAHAFYQSLGYRGNKLQRNFKKPV